MDRPVLRADGGQMTVGRRQATYVYGAFDVRLPEGREQAEQEQRLQNGYLYRPDEPMSGRFDVGFIRADATIDLSAGTSDLEAQLDAAQRRMEGDIFFERDITTKGTGRYRPGIDIRQGDIVDVLIWGMILPLPITRAEMTSNPDTTIGWRWHVGGSLISDATALRNHNDQILQQIAQEKRQRLQSVGAATAKAETATRTANAALARSNTSSEEATAALQDARTAAGDARRAIDEAAQASLISEDGRRQAIAANTAAVGAQQKSIEALTTAAQANRTASEANTRSIEANKAAIAQVDRTARWSVRLSEWLELSIPAVVAVSIDSDNIYSDWYRVEISGARIRVENKSDYRMFVSYSGVEGRTGLVAGNAGGFGATVIYLNARETHEKTYASQGGIFAVTVVMRRIVPKPSF